MSIYSGVPFTIGLFLLVITWALVVSGWSKPVTDRLYKMSLAFLILAALAMPLGWFFYLPMYQGFFGLAAVGVLLAVLFGTIEYRQKKGLQ